MQKRIYLDHAATTPIDERVTKLILKSTKELFANPGGLYDEAILAKKALEKARKDTADILSALPDEIVFTSGGTESDNLALFGVVRKAKEDFSKKKIHIIVSLIEHAAILEVAQELEKEGVLVSYATPDKDGIISPKTIESLLKTNTVLVSVMHANNEIGTIQPIREIAKVIRHFRKNNKMISPQYPVFHTDSSQTASYLSLRVPPLGVDMMTLSSQKIYGPRGVGVLYVRRGVNLKPIVFGGDQEHGIRPGTENVPFIVGFAEALRISESQKASEFKRLTVLRDYFIKKLLDDVPGAVLNGHGKERLPNNVNISVKGMDNDFLVISLASKGILCSTRSACKTNNEKGSHVILALRGEKNLERESLRFSLGRDTTKEKLNTTVRELSRIVKEIKKFEKDIK
jgi:cysteine desulfurase